MRSRKQQAEEGASCFSWKQSIVESQDTLNILVSGHFWLEVAHVAGYFFMATGEQGI